jgi:hypothetical protein
VTKASPPKSSGRFLFIRVYWCLLVVELNRYD